MLRSLSEGATALGTLRTDLPQEGGRLPARRHVFVVGQHRSGTSLLARTIAGQPEASGFENTGVMEDEGQHLQTVIEPADSMTRLGYMRGGHLTERSALATPENRDKLWAEWAPYWDTSKAYLVEKSPSNVVRMRLMQYYFPDSSFVWVRRHPIAVCMALTKMLGTTKIVQRTMNWVRCQELALADSEKIERVCSFRYEDFVADPGATLGQLSNVVGFDVPLPAEPVRPDVNERYFEEWREWAGTPRGRVILPALKLAFEKRINAFGYSLEV